MFISYRRTGGAFALLTFAAVALAATFLTVVVGATVLVVALAAAAVALVVRTVRPARSRPHIVRSAAWPHQTFDTTAVHPAASADEGDVLRLDSDKG